MTFISVVMAALLALVIMRIVDIFVNKLRIRQITGGMIVQAPPMDQLLMDYINVYKVKVVGGGVFLVDRHSMHPNLQRINVQLKGGYISFNDINERAHKYQYHLVVLEDIAGNEIEIS